MPSTKSTNTKTIVMYRNSKTGELVTPAYANSHKATTEREVRKIISKRSTTDRSMSRRSGR